MRAALVAACLLFSLAAQADNVVLWHAYRGDEQAALEKVIEQFLAHEAREGRSASV